VKGANPGNGGQAGSGGAGGAGASGTGGVQRASAAPTNTLPIHTFTRDLLRGISLLLGGGGAPGGGGGGGDGSSGAGGGSGGNGGGVIWISARIINRSGSTAVSCIRANGGNGGNGFTPAAGNRGGGGGAGAGGGGFIVIFYGSLTGSTATNAIATDGGNGGNGGNGLGTGIGGNGGNGGYLPGDSFEKMKPFISQLMAYLEDFLGKKTLDSFMKEEKIIFAPINEMRGSSFSQCMVIVDEAQNLNEIELKMVLTRIGENCRMVINGDCKQSDLVFSKDAFFAITGKLRPLTEISFVRFTKEDIVRSGIVRRIIEVLEED
jgi:hypothetical protein